MVAMSLDASMGSTSHGHHNISNIKIPHFLTDIATILHRS